MRKSKRKPNASFMRTEKRLYHTLLAIVKKCQGLAVKVADLTRKTGIARSTFYRHHHDINGLIKETEIRTLENFEPVVKSLLKNQSNYQVIFFRFLIFIRKNRDCFQMNLELGNYKIFLQLLTQLQPIITKNWTDYGNSDMIYYVYCHEVIAVISAWYREDRLSESSIDHYVHSIVHLTNNASSHLSRLPKRRDFDAKAKTSSRRPSSAKGSQC